MKILCAAKKIRFLIFSAFLISASVNLPLNLSAQEAKDYYWENPVRITKSDSRFPVSVYNEKGAAFFWQEIDEKNQQIYISGSFLSNGSWNKKSRFAGPFPYSGEIPDLYSAAMNTDGKIAVSVLSDTNTISVFITGDNGNSFSRKDFERQKLPLVAPRIYSLYNGSFALFTSLGKDESFSMLWSRSSDGEKWSDFQNFAPASSFTNPFLPSLASTKEADYLLFQAQYNTGTRLSYQLYFTRSSNGGASWSQPELISGDDSLPAGETASFSAFHNQRPALLSKNGSLYACWERTKFNSENARIVFAELNPATGSITGKTEEISFDGNAGRPILFTYCGKLSLVWFDTRQGAESVFLSQKNGVLWHEQKLSKGRSPCMFAFPIITQNGKELSFIWQTNNSGNDVPSINLLETDKTVLPPALKPDSFKAGERSRNENVRVTVRLPQDSSGVKGFSYLWTKEKEKKCPEYLSNLPDENHLALKADSDGWWYLKVRCLDYAGNWSDEEILSYNRDLTPPRPPVIDFDSFDSAGFVSSNTFSVSWHDESPDEVIGGYSYKLEGAYPIPRAMCWSKKHPLRITDAELKSRLDELKRKNPEGSLKKSAPPSRITTHYPRAGFANERNGAYVFSVRAIDSVGNVGEPSHIVLYLNKYEPYTVLNSVKKSSDIFGNTSIELLGSGFLYDGTISEIRIKSEKDYELVLKRSAGDFKIQSDSKITDIKLDNTAPEGKYTITLFHTDRGIYRSNKAFSITQSGTVIVANEYKYISTWKAITKIGKLSIQPGEILLALILILAISGIIFCVRGIASVTKDARIINLEVRALLEGDIMPLEKKSREMALRQKGLGLKVKLVSFTVFLVLMVSLLVSLPLGYIMTRSQERTLLRGLEQRVNVLLESVSSGVRSYLPTQNILELSYLPAQSSALDEAGYVTITGAGNETGTQDNNLDYVWATNDSEITSRIDTDELRAGSSRIKDETFQNIYGQLILLNEDAASKIGDMGKNIAALNSEAALLALKTDSASVSRRTEISQITRELQTKINDQFNKISRDGTGSYPSFDNEILDRTNTDYIFYRPVLYRQGSSSKYVHGVVFISISTKSLIEKIDYDKKNITLMAISVSLLAIIIGSIGAMILGSVIVNPIRRLARHVTMIGQTQNKIELEGKDIKIKSHDEIGILGDSINDMTQGLVEAAKAEIEAAKIREENIRAREAEAKAKEEAAEIKAEAMKKEKMELDGKAVQQAFIPLVQSRVGKQTTADLNEDAVQIFGYYEGADAVSGDYFDYKKLDDKWYAIIKCDISGHGVPAALIMTVVATLFRKYFETWSFKSNGTKLDLLVTQINDFIESLGLKGKFATLMICLFNTKSGEVYMCNAGDNIIHFFDTASKKQKKVTLHEAPAAGPLPSFMVQMKGGFKVEKLTLKKDDVLFLYTDGIEESTRFFRDANFNVIPCSEPGLKEGEVHATHKVGTTSEQLEPERVKEIIEAVFNKKQYELIKYHNPVANERLIFDFAKCGGTLDESIIALAAVEKVFRFYKKPGAHGTVIKNADGEIEIQGDAVRVDRKIDAFLKKYFEGYSRYCSRQIDMEEGNYIYYADLNEDPQADDLTLLAVRKK